jgi:hypothetical protein
MTTPLSLNGINEIDFANGISSISTTNDVATITFASSGGTVTHTGGPLTAGQLVLGNGGDDIEVGDLSGDVTTSGSGATTLAKIQTKTLTITSPAANDILKYNGTTWVNSTLSAIPSANASQIQSVNVSSVTPQKGDIFRYNEYADSKWDLTTAFARTVSVVAEANNNGGGTTLTTVGAATSPTINLGGGSSAQSNATATEGMGVTYTTLSSAGTQSCFLVFSATGAGNGRFSLGTMRRWSARLKLNQSANVRYWFGLADNAVVFEPGSSDTPNANIIAFRFSSTTDTVIKAYTATSSASNTATTTGTAVDTTASHLFEITYDGTNATFFIDGAQVAQTAATMPASSTMMNWVMSIDNKAAGVADSLTFQWMSITMR